MKNTPSTTVLVLGILFLFTTIFVIMGFIFYPADLYAQEDPDPGQEATEEIPFIDRDGDGINDFFQHPWGARMLERHKRLRERRQAENHEPFLIDTDNDGVPDTPVGQFFRQKMDELIDTDNDGVPDTPLREYLRNQAGSFDRDGDGVPDIATPEEIREHMLEMQAWREQIRERINQGENPFVDEDGDGIPDGMPQRLPFRRGGMHNQNRQDSGQ